MRDKVRAALMGAGRMAQTHARVLGAVPTLELCAVCDPVAEHAARLAETLGLPTRTLEAVLADPNLDAVILATPTPTHARLIRQAAAAGKHIFVEKTRRRHTRRSGRGSPGPSGRLGCSVRWGFSAASIPPTPRRSGLSLWVNWVSSPPFGGVSRDPAPPPLDFLKTSGGLMVDLGIHDLDTMRFLVGEVAEIYAIGSFQKMPELAEYGLFDSAVATVRFDDGALGTLELGLHTAYGYDIRAEVLGELGRLHLEMTSPLHLTRYTAEGMIERGPQNFEERFLEAYTAEFRAFAACLLEDRPVSPDAEDAAKTLRLALAAQRALETNQAVQVASFTEKDKVDV